MAAKAPALQARIVSAYSKLNKKELVRQEVERLVDLYRPNTPWYKAQERKKDTLALEYAYDLTESHLRDLVTEYHRDAQKRKNIETYELARDIYRNYLEAFRDSESAYQMNFFYGKFFGRSKNGKMPLWNTTELLVGKLKKVSAVVSLELQPTMRFLPGKRLQPKARRCPKSKRQNSRKQEEG